MGTAFPGFSAPGPLRRLRWRVAAHAASLSRQIARDLEERRFFLFVAVAFALGALVYFALPREPLLGALLPAALFAALAAFLSWWRGGPFGLLVLLAALLAGASAAKLRVESLTAPQLERTMSGEVRGRVLDIEIRAGRAPRAVLDSVRIAKIGKARTPERIRLTFRGDPPPLGSIVTARARLSPVPGPAMPGGYDPARAAFFDGIGAGGFVFGSFTVIEEPRGFRPLGILAALRQRVAARIADASPGEAGAVAVALLVGERGLIGEETAETLRVAGLAHILAISGLHMMLMAGTTFWLVRAGMALMEGAALGWPLRKIAAIAALAVGTFYLAISGGNVATIRAFVMAGVMFAAILVDRPALSLRNLAIAAFIVVALQPESVAEPGFQMSFAAVAALISVWELWRERPVDRLAEPPSWPWRLTRRLAGALLAIALTTLVAGFATAPFAAYHFGRFASYSLLGNLLAMPLVSLVVMPAGLLSLALMPFGLDPLPLAVMTTGIDLVLAAARWVSGLPGSSLSIAPFPAWTLLIATAGFLWLCLWRSPVRLYGLVPLLVGALLAAALSSNADLIVEESGKAIAARGADGILRVEGARAGSYLADMWLTNERAGEGGLAEGFLCDGEACLFAMKGGLRLSHVLSPLAFAEDCDKADVIVTALPAPPGCRAPIVIDRERLAARGAHALRVGSAGPAKSDIRTARPAMRRPWQGVPAL
ncbi:ComEC/Rec2 family competence protein [Afifella sp. IM 167]|uniref:ComEC/Rec2 family competence protein n=1 Tax=Afifella sp. IM 167 TaxID=2033586 RepID=UPI001CCED6C4|nr:ComEC/Rec2 family competence protein [Afifella sp. IM 167]